MKTKDSKKQKVYIPKGYISGNIYQTQKDIKKIKDFFQKCLAETLNLQRVSAPLMVLTKDQINDGLTGEHPVTFKTRDNLGSDVEIVQSLAKWKRVALKKYGYSYFEGIYCDMNAIRPEETLSNIHSLYVDQWDWEMVIPKSERTIEFLHDTVEKIFSVLKKTEEFILKPCQPRLLPDQIKFIDSEELYKMHSGDTKEVEKIVAEKYGAIFISKIGHGLKSNNGKPHDNRSPDYDDWDLNGDLIVWNPVLEDALELSSMGIRVDKESLKKQMKITGREKNMKAEYYVNIENDILPYTIGGGIGQSRLCMFFLQKAFIGEVQASVWPKEIIDDLTDRGINIL